MTATGLTRRCSGCGLDRPPTSFRKKGDRLTSRCKTCLAEEDRARYLADPSRSRDARIRRYHGMSAVEYDLLFASLYERQDGRCAICRKAPEGRANHGSLHLDHDHLTGKKRGLLCGRCNAGVGQFQDDPALMRAAAAYIEDR